MQTLNKTIGGKRLIHVNFGKIRAGLSGGFTLFLFDLLRCSFMLFASRLVPRTVSNTSFVVVDRLVDASGGRIISRRSGSRHGTVSPQERCSSALASKPQQSIAVRPKLQQRRPLVNGEAVAFHVNDLVKPAASSAAHFNQFSPSSNNLAAAQEELADYDSDLIVVLDMDECLIHSQFLSAGNTHLAHQLRSNMNRRRHSSGQVVDSFRVTLPDGDLVHVNVRPGLYDFIQDVTDRFETHVYTAAMEVYAKPVLDRIDPHNKLSGRWYREHCQFEQGAYVKQLHNLPIYDAHNKDPLRRVVLVDNNPLSFLANPENGILVSSFYNDPTDTTLPAVWNLLEELDEQHTEDVRPHLIQRFGLKEALCQQLKERQQQ